MCDIECVFVCVCACMSINVCAFLHECVYIMCAFFIMYESFWCACNFCFVFIYIIF